MDEGRSFKTFLAALRAWLAAARDEEVTDLLKMVRAEQERRGTEEPPAPPPTPDATPPANGNEAEGDRAP